MRRKLGVVLVVVVAVLCVVVRARVKAHVHEGRGDGVETPAQQERDALRMTEDGLQHEWHRLEEEQNGYRGVVVRAVVRHVPEEWRDAGPVQVRLDGLDGVRLLEHAQDANDARREVLWILVDRELLDEATLDPARAQLVIEMSSPALGVVQHQTRALNALIPRRVSRRLAERSRRHTQNTDGPDSNKEERSHQRRPRTVANARPAHESGPRSDLHAHSRRHATAAATDPWEEFRTHERKVHAAREQFLGSGILHTNVATDPLDDGLNRLDHDGDASGTGPAASEQHVQGALHTVLFNTSASGREVHDALCVLHAHATALLPELPSSYSDILSPTFVAIAQALEQQNVRHQHPHGHASSGIVSARWYSQTASLQALSAFGWLFLVGDSRANLPQRHGPGDWRISLFGMRAPSARRRGRLVAIPRGVAMAKTCFDAAASLGDADAHAMLGFLYASSSGSANVDKAILHWTLAANGGSAYAQMALGFRYMYGIGGLEKNCDTAAMLYERAAARVVGDELVLSEHPGAASSGTDPQPDLQQHVHMHSISASPTGDLMQYHASLDRVRLSEHADAGLSGAGGVRGKLRKQGPDDEIIQYYIHNANNGDSTAQVIIGQLYFLGLHGMPRDERRARYWFEKAAELYDARAMANLGFMYAHGLGGLARDDALALELFERATEQNDAAGWNGLGWCYTYGVGTPDRAPDLAKAFKYFSKAAELGHAEAMYNVGVMQLSGATGSASAPKGAEFAFKSFKRAARRGHWKGMYQAGVMFRHAHGVSAHHPHQQVHGDAHTNLVHASHCEAAARLLKQVAEFGTSVSVLLQRAIDAYEDADYAAALMRFRMAAEAGVEVAQHNAAFIFERHNVEADLGFTSASEFVAANEVGRLDGPRSLGAPVMPPLLMDRVPSGVYAAMDEYERSAIQGASDSALRLGDLAFELFDYDKARVSYLAASSAELAVAAQARVNLAWMHARGKGFESSDLNMAMRYLTSGLHEDSNTGSTGVTSMDNDLPIAVMRALLPIYFKYKFLLDPTIDWVEALLRKYREGSPFSRLLDYYVAKANSYSTESSQAPAKAHVAGDADAAQDMDVGSHRLDVEVGVEELYSFYDLSANVDLVIIGALCVLLAFIVVVRRKRLKMNQATEAAVAAAVPHAAEQVITSEQDPSRHENDQPVRDEVPEPAPPQVGS
ncbi:Protein sel-1-like 1 [Porphyridium purpureum]|uniref:Protein sel-1-like 1 n=1 Tax=Porphyridium purpureum TaxID=35688 RepID=A0A5J4YK51_PORPP|nr:Protein sel-1-like 1 [Porphyridium purpureum]|eukprot:POR9533..scf210_14